MCHVFCKPVITTVLSSVFWYVNNDIDSNLPERLFIWSKYWHFIPVNECFGFSRVNSLKRQIRNYICISIF